MQLPRRTLTPDRSRTRFSTRLLGMLHTPSLTVFPTITKSVFMKTIGTKHPSLSNGVVMPFGLKNAPPTYQRIVNQIFKDYLNDFMKLFLDDFSVYSEIETHLPKLRHVFERCRQYDVNLNPDKCIFYVPSGVILGYIVCQAGKFPDPKKIEALVNMP